MVSSTTKELEVQLDLHLYKNKKNKHKFISVFQLNTFFFNPLLTLFATLALAKVKATNKAGNEPDDDYHNNSNQAPHFNILPPHCCFQ